MWMQRGRACGGWSDDKKYYFDETGAMVTGITVIKEKFYSFNANGKFNKEKTQKIRKTAKYEKPFSGLQKYIGKPKKQNIMPAVMEEAKMGFSPMRDLQFIRLSRTKEPRFLWE